MPKVNLSGIRIGKFNRRYTVQVDWDSDRHHLIQIPVGAPPAEVVHKLRLLADVIENDDQVQEQRSSIGDEDEA